MIWFLLIFVIAIPFFFIHRPGEKGMKKGYDRFKVNDFYSAKECYSSAIAENPRSWFAYYRRGLCLIKLGEIEAAKEDMRKAIEIDEKYSDLAKNALMELENNKN